ncbi:MAG: hypothetical protein AB7G06_06125 [Bdellovibrionales bacterium]
MTCIIQKHPGSKNVDLFDSSRLSIFIPASGTVLHVIGVGGGVRFELQPKGCSRSDATVVEFGGFGACDARSPHTLSGAANLLRAALGATSMERWADLSVRRDVRRDSDVEGSFMRIKYEPEMGCMIEMRGSEVHHIFLPHGSISPDLMRNFADMADAMQMDNIVDRNEPALPALRRRMAAVSKKPR